MASPPKLPRLANPRAQGARLERAGDLAGALAAYEAALAAAPDDPDLLSDIAHLAERLEMHPTSAKLWERVIALRPGRLEAVDGRARALRELGFYDEAIALLRQTLLATPEEPRLWNTLGVTLMQSGQTELSLTFFDEAIRLDERFAVALYNRGGARFDLGHLEAASEDFARARKLARRASDVAMIEFATSLLTLARGDVGPGWDAYEVRFSRDHPRPVVFDAPGRRWSPTVAIAGKRLLVVAEQGLGDEIMFANVLPEVIADLGETGRLTLAVEPRLVDLFARSFPAAQVIAHATEDDRGRKRRSTPALSDPTSVEVWAPMGSLLRKYRREVGDFPTRAGYLTPDPARVAYWRAWLGEGPPAVGISWRSGKVLGDRRRQYPPLDLWADLLETPGVRFVNVQYGDCADELKALSEASGTPVLQAPGLDVRDHIDDLAALCGALDLVVSVGNATGALAAACGRPTGLIVPPANWPGLGTETYPWYPSASALAAPSFGDWAPAMAAAKALVGDLARR